MVLIAAYIEKNMQRQATIPLIYTTDLSEAVT